MSAPVTLPVERLIPMIRNTPGRYVQALADRAEDLLAENKRLRELLAVVREDLVAEAFKTSFRTQEGRHEEATAAGKRVQEIHAQIDEAIR